MTLGKERIMSKNVKVLFWRDPHWTVQATLGNLPKKEDIERDYMELPIPVKRNNLDSIFAQFNGSRNPLIDMQKWVRDNQLHTSMSVGDIVKLGENDYYICMNLGWRKLEV